MSLVETLAIGWPANGGGGVGRAWREGWQATLSNNGNASERTRRGMKISDVRIQEWR
jgi:hypothetical protein